VQETNAKQTASALVFSKEDMFQTHSQDEYGRTLADVLLPVARDGSWLCENLARDRSRGRLPRRSRDHAGKSVLTDVLILQLRDGPLHPNRTELPFKRRDPSAAGLLEYPVLFVLDLSRASRRVWELRHHKTS
jgi:hypothetical protein